MKPGAEVKALSALTKEEWREYTKTVWSIANVSHDLHPATFPTEIPKRLTKLFSFWGETLLDPFGGVGSTAVAAIREALDREPTVANFRAFRELLGAITGKVLEIGYRLEKVGGTAIDPHYHEVIAVIDREADQLYQLMLRQQKDHIAITTKILEIKGLVVDLLS